MKIKVVIHDAEEGGHWAEVPAIPGVVEPEPVWSLRVQALRALLRPRRR